MGISDRDWQKDNYDKALNRKPDLSKTRYNSKGDLELDDTPKRQKRPTIDYLEKIYKNPSTPKPQSPSYYEDDLPLPFLIAFFVVLVVGLNVFFYYLNEHRTTVATMPSVASPINVATPLATIVDMPQTSVIQSFFNQKDALCPFSFYAPPNKNNYYFKLKDSHTKQLILVGFCRSGETLKTKVPVGSYVLDWASGETWQNENLLFGGYTIIQRADNILNFSFDGSQYLGYSLFMSETFDGNLQHSYLPQSHF